MGQAPAGDSYNDRGIGLPLVAGAGDMANGVVVASKYTTKPTKVSKPEDIILGIRASIGQRARSEQAVCLGRGVAAIRAGADVDRAYLWHWIGFAAPFLAAKGRGATFLQVNRTDIEEMRISLPPVDEQRRIAQILDQADWVASAAQRQAVLADDLRVAVFRAGTSADERWPTVLVGELLDTDRGGIRTGPFGSQLLHSEFVDAGVQVLGIDNAVGNEFRWGERRFITEEKYRQLRRYEVNPGDVLITIMGTCGRVAVVPDDIGVAINTKHLCCITLDQSLCLPQFLHAYFLWHPVARKYLRSRAKGAIMDGLNMGIIKGLPVVLPPVSVQRDVVRRLDGVDATRSRMDASRIAVDRLRSSLRNRAFAGEL
jgi:type I restriction enzyme, S subunit